MNNKTASRSRAKNDKDSILADVKNMLKIFHGAYSNMTKFDRMDGPAADFRRAALDIIKNFNMAKECPEIRLQCIQQMFGDFGVLLSMFELCSHLMTANNRLAIAAQLDRIEEGVRKWRKSVRSQQYTISDSLAGHAK